MPYDIGDAVTLTTTCRDANGNTVDVTPPPVLTVTKPDGTATTPVVTHVGAAGSGQYQGVQLADQAGTWLYLWTTTGTLVAAEPGQFTVTPQTVMVASLEEFKDHLNRNGADRDADDNELRNYLGAATRVVEYLAGPISKQTVTERFTTTSGVIMPRTTPLIDVVSVTDDYGKTVTIADPNQCIVDTLTGSVTLRIAGFYTGTIVYHAGRTAIPYNLKMAGLIIAQNMWQVQNGGAGLPFPGEIDVPTITMAGQTYLIPNRARQYIAAENTSIEQVGGIA